MKGVDELVEGEEEPIFRGRKVTGNSCYCLTATAPNSSEFADELCLSVLCLIFQHVMEVDYGAADLHEADCWGRCRNGAGIMEAELQASAPRKQHQPFTAGTEAFMSQEMAHFPS
ncbi:hypothetical protein CRENBAI_003311 [Crenichthys baileyi]|uniref:Uncharacterized protein n=1 Tax=Crenichthys baileyi TaxID=28760 RepID=A0AAV9RBV4_9TELE